jgi:predicted RND superfamily exporter protein
MITQILQFLKRIPLKDAFPYMILVCMFFYFQSQKSSQQSDLVSMVNAISDSTSHKIDNLGRQFSETSQIRSSDSKIFLSVKSDDAAVKALQEEVKRLKGKLTEGTHVDTTTVNGKFSDVWVSINNSVPNRSIVDVRNHYSVSLLKDKGEYVVQVRNDNPYSKGIDSIKTFVKVPAPEKKWSLGVGAGYNPIDGRIIPVIGIQHKLINLF